MALTGRIPVEFSTVFPAGAYAVEVVPVQEFDEQARKVTGQARDRASGLPLWTVVVHDPDPEARTHEVRVKVAAEKEPELPAEVVGHPLRPVEFVGLSVTPYLDSGGRRPRVGLSFRADGLRAPSTAGTRKGGA